MSGVELGAGFAEVAEDRLEAWEEGFVFGEVPWFVAFGVVVAVGDVVIERLVGVAGFVAVHGFAEGGDAIGERFFIN